MKHTLYMDVYPGMNLQYACASSMMSHEKMETTHRLAFSIDIPDWMIASATKPDHIAEVVEPVREVK